MGQDRHDEQELRELLTGIYQSVVLELHGKCTDVDEEGPFHVIAVGKAAAWMYTGVMWTCTDGIIVCPSADGWEPEEVIVLEGDHPLPGPRSLAAGKRVADYARAIPRGSRVVGLLSGGASALMEVLKPEWTLETFRAETDRLMRGGADIWELNAFRQSASLLKGGGLGRMLEGCDVRVYVVSDVKGSDFSVIGSGPFWTGDIPHVLLADGETARQAAIRHLEGQELEVRSLPWISGEAREEGVQFGRQALTLRSREALVAVGEPVVTVQGDGIGGRAQEFAMGAASVLAGESGIAVLAAGTDGRDGPTDAAGAVVDGGSWDSLSLEELERSDSFAWGVRRGVGIPRWETGTNVNDLFLAVRE